MANELRHSPLSYILPTLVLACPAPAAALIGASPDEETNSVVAVVDGEQVCTGFVSGPRTVITAAHCIDGPSPVVAIGHTQQDWVEFTVDRVEISDALRDVARVYTVDDLGVEPLAFAEVERDAEFAAVGYGRDRGGESGVRRRLAGQRVLCVGAACSDDAVTVQTLQFLASGGPCEGDSGGPAIDENGRVIGIVVEADDACSVALYTTLTEAPAEGVPKEPASNGCGGSAGFIFIPVWLTAVSRGRKRTSQ